MYVRTVNILVRRSTWIDVRWNYATANEGVLEPERDNLLRLRRDATGPDCETSCARRRRRRLGFATWADWSPPARTRLLSCCKTTECLL